MDVVVVESPTKAKTINKYLGEGYTVLASFGHVRDLPQEDGSVLPEEDFKIIYEPLDEKKKRVEEIARALKGAKRLILATDPDREGEAISWHLLELLRQKKALKDLDVRRVVFHEVTKPAVIEAMRHGRDLDAHLIDAYQARRALDYLVGFKLSPVLWRKLPKTGSSAGRVQSVALRLICEREAEILAFRPQEYWTVEALLETPEGKIFKARLTALDGKKLDKFALPDQAAAERAVAAVRARELLVQEIEKKQVSRNPAPPFSTSTLQQEASRKLGFSADRTMKTAQRLFEGVDLGGETVGLITYMRTDSVQLSSEALGACRKLIGQRFGDRYLPEKPRQFKTKTKNAQEAHEAIRPTDLFRLPADLRGRLDEDQRRLYELIWQRTVASQMAAAVLDRVIVDIGAPDRGVGLRATGQTVAFDGFLKLYQEGRDDPPLDADDEEGGLLPPLKVADPLKQREVTPSRHFTEPPPRYTEASLVKRMEELGIGRPSTYASIISVLQARDYVRLESKRFVPEDKGWLVNAFLVEEFGHWVEYGFTAQLEDQLDDVAGGALFWKDVLRQFWEPFSRRLAEVGERRQREIIDALDHALGPLLFQGEGGEVDPRACPRCGEGRLSLKLSGFGPFIGCSRYPECNYTKPFTLGGRDSESERTRPADRLLGVDHTNDEEVWVKAGRYGPYVQRGSGAEAKRCSLAPGMPPETIDLATALRLLDLPREIGKDPEAGESITAGIGRFGPYVQRGKTYVNLPPDEDVLTIGLNRAAILLAEGANGRGRRPKAAEPLRELGAHPEDGEPVLVLAGRFGPYVKHGKLNASLPQSLTPETITLDQALELLRARAAKLAEGGAARSRGKKAGKAGAKTGKAKAGGAEAKAAKASPDKAKPSKAKKAPKAEAGVESTEAAAVAAKPGKARARPAAARKTAGESRELAETAAAPGSTRRRKPARGAGESA